MKIRLLTLALVWTCCLCAQHRFSWQDACFKNPGLPYCPGHDFAVKPTKGGAAGSSTRGAWTFDKTTDAGGIDWRFADPAAEAVAVLNCSKLPGAPLALGLIDQLAANQGLREGDLQNLSRALSGIEQVAFSVHENKIVLLVTGRAPDSVLPAPQAEWKAVSLGGNAVLLGNADAVDQAAIRLSLTNPLAELPRLALERKADSEFWAAGTGKLAGQEAVAAGVKRFSLTAAMHDGLTTETAFEFEAAPDATAIQPWLKTLGETKIEGKLVEAKMSMPSEETRQSFDKIAGSPLGQRLAPLIQSARSLPVRDTASTKHTKPVIYGLDDGAKEVR